ncbi:MAG: ACT domain-containing protein [Firmicutes bacterium]|nr:ACT domain-containing protein [Bacillota bacterium]
MKAIITVLGKDTVGIMYNVSRILAEQGVNIEDVTQTILQDYFTMLMVVNIDETKSSFSELKAAMTEMGEEQGLSINVQKEEIFAAMHRV